MATQALFLVAKNQRARRTSIANHFWKTVRRTGPATIADGIEKVQEKGSKFPASAVEDLARSAEKWG